MRSARSGGVARVARGDLNGCLPASRLCPTCYVFVTPVPEAAYAQTVWGGLAGCFPTLTAGPPSRSSGLASRRAVPRRLLLDAAALVGLAMRYRDDTPGQGAGMRWSPPADVGARSWLTHGYVATSPCWGVAGRLALPVVAAVTGPSPGRTPRSSSRQLASPRGARAEQLFHWSLYLACLPRRAVYHLLC